MSNNDANRPLFILEKKDRMLLILTTTDTLDQPGPKAPLWHMEFDRNYPAQNAVVWVGEREHLWPEWQRIAETRGTDALQSHIERIWETQPIEHADRRPLRAARRCGWRLGGARPLMAAITFPARARATLQKLLECITWQRGKDM